MNDDSQNVTDENEHDEYKISKIEPIHILPPDNSKYKWMNYIPIAYWLPHYNVKKNMVGDFIAGLTAGIMLIPQGMAYALIAGLDPKIGLYSAMFGPIIYTFFGTSGQLSVAPVAIVSLLTAEAVESVMIETEEDPHYESKYLSLASTLAFQVGISQTILGLLKAGMLASMLSHSVIVGFTGAAALLIGMSQIKYCLKITINRGEFIEMLIDLIKNINNTHWETLILSICCIIILLLLKYWKKNKKLIGSYYAQFIPGALIIVVFGTLLSYGINDTSLFDIVGKQKNGLPNTSNFFNNINNNQFWTLWTTSLLISLIAFIESFAVANKYAEMKNYHVDASQEFLALGLANLIACWFQTYPVTGGLSRTAVAEAAGAVTPLNSLIAGVFMIFALSVLLTLFEWLPNACLGSIVLVAVINLFDYKTMIHLWKLKKRDFYVMLITLLITLFLGIEIGVATGVIASVLMFIQRASKPHYAILGKLLDKENTYRNIKNYENIIIRNDILIIRWDASLFFGNIDVFKKRILKHIGRFLNKNSYPNDWCLILSFSGINDCDASAAESLHSFFHELNHKFDSIQLLITNMKKPVRLVLEIAEVIDVIKEDHLFFEIHDAVKWWDNYKSSINDDQHENSNNSNDGNPLLYDDGVKTSKKGDASDNNLIHQNDQNDEQKDNQDDNDNVVDDNVDDNVDDDPDVDDDHHVSLDIKD